VSLSRRTRLGAGRVSADFSAMASGSRGIEEASAATSNPGEAGTSSGRDRSQVPRTSETFYAPGLLAMRGSGPVPMGLPGTGMGASPSPRCGVDLVQPPQGYPIPRTNTTSCKPACKGAESSLRRGSDALFPGERPLAGDTYPERDILSRQSRVSKHRRLFFSFFLFLHFFFSPFLAFRHDPAGFSNTGRAAGRHSPIPSPSNRQHVGSEAQFPESFRTALVACLLWIVAN